MSEFFKVGMLRRALERMRDPLSIFHMAKVVFTTNVIVQAVFIVSSVLLVRHLSKSDYGLWRVLGALTAFPQLLFVGFDHAITRFVPVEARRNADAVVWSVFLLKAAATGLILLVFALTLPVLPRWMNISLEMQPLFSRLFWLMLASSAVSVISTTVFATANAHKLFSLVLRVSVAKQIATFICVIGVITLDLGIAQYVVCEVFLNVLQVVYLWRAIKPVTKERGGDLLAAARALDRWTLLRNGWDQYVKAYAMPLNASSLLSYVRGYVPLLLLGSRFSLESAAVYSILKNILTTIHKTIGGVVEGVFPRVFEMYETDRAVFVRRFYRYMGAAYLLRGSLGAAVFFGAPIIFWVYKIDSTPALMVVLAILVLEFLMTEVTSVSNVVVLLSKRTTALLWSSGIRFVVEAILIAFVTLRYGILGAAITLFVSRSVEGLVTVWASNRVFPLRRQYLAFAVVLTAFAITLIRTALPSFPLPFLS